jgi:predicted DNA binding CopG/RHH family protein
LIAILVSLKGTVKLDMKREKNIRIALSEEEYELLKSESDKKGIPMTSLIRLYIQGLKPEVENRSPRSQK